MKPARKLALKKELLTELTAEEMRHVAGAAAWTPGCPLTIEIQERLSELTACYAC